LFGLEAPSEFYSDPVNFEIKHDDISGLEIRAHRGASIAGVAVIEGTTDPSAMEKLGRAELFATVFATVMEESSAPGFSRTRIASDGAFQLKGLRPGKANIVLQELSGLLRITRVERNGVPQSEGIEIAAGDHFTDLRLVIAFANAVIRGQVNIEGGSLPRDARLSVSALRKTGAGDQGDRYDASERSAVEPSGRFEIEGLVPGEYEVTVTTVLNPGAPATARQVRTARQQVTVTGDSPAEVVLVLDLGKASKKDPE
jgi:hypothetical protein